MNIDNLVNDALRFFNQYPLVIAAIIVVVLFAVYAKPKESFKLFIFLLFMAAVFYAISLFGDSLSKGGASKNQMIYKSKKLVD